MVARGRGGGRGWEVGISRGQDGYTTRSYTCVGVTLLGGNGQHCVSTVVNAILNTYPRVKQKYAPRLPSSPHRVQPRGTCTLRGQVLRAQHPRAHLHNGHSSEAHRVASNTTQRGPKSIHVTQHRPRETIEGPSTQGTPLQRKLAQLSLQSQVPSWVGKPSSGHPCAYKCFRSAAQQAMAS